MPETADEVLLSSRRVLLLTFVMAFVLVLGGVIFGAIFGSQLGSVSDVSETLDCRARARVPYDAVRDERDNLFAAGLLAATRDDDVRLAEIQQELLPVLDEIQNGPTLLELYEKAGCT